ncbi:MAG: M20/M25/M40 family metallo-hydrolase [Gammaproteobacteria bacterium TMED134]|nr:MAG: M20/M25/M40 family metallo-hydrolase [Gammaproteobacteria bacterium TMED134]RPG47073.1 MAG: M20/M25/M40 family metallo-hydrolase [Gammaproteobacteria bacterium TMED134]
MVKHLFLELCRMLRWHRKGSRGPAIWGHWSSLALPLLLLSTALSRAEPSRLDVFAAQAAERLSQYIQVDTTNPPGNEGRGVAFLAQIFDQAGIQYETAESAPGRGNIWATLPGNPDAELKPALILLHHIDVVPANAEYWSVPPLSGTQQDGFIYGRGAIDTKGLGIAQLQAFLALAESETALNRDVIYMATADEEAGGFFGVGWLIENRPELFQGVGFVLNEGGSARLFDEQSVVLLEVTQKVPLWLRLTAKGRPGHGSSPQVNTSVTRLIRGLSRISETEFPPRVIDPVAVMFEGLAPYQTARDRRAYANLRESVGDPDFLLMLRLRSPSSHALLRNTCSITTLEGSSKINVVPAEVYAELDCRLLPDQDPARFVDQIKTILSDDLISVETIMSFTPAVSRTDTPLFAAIAQVSEQTYAAPVVPIVSGGFTDSHFLRDLGITSYGYSPFAFAPDEATGIHGNNERLSVENLERGVRTLYRLLDLFTQTP